MPTSESAAEAAREMAQTVLHATCERADADGSYWQDEDGGPKMNATEALGIVIQAARDEALEEAAGVIQACREDGECDHRSMIHWIRSLKGTA